METIIGTTISAIATVVVAVYSRKTNKKADNLVNIKNELKEEIKKTNNEIKGEVISLQKQIDNNEKDYLRFQILSFAGDLRNRH